MRTTFKSALILITSLGLLGCGEPRHVPGQVSAPDRSAKLNLLERLANRFFPGNTSSIPSARLFRLTRSQIDNTVKGLIPIAGLPLVSDALPRDPLETNYEFATNLGIDASNFAQYAAWVGQISAAVLTNPSTVIDCSAQSNASSCLDSQAQSFVRKALRAAPLQDIQRFTKFFNDSVAEVGIAQASADLVQVVLGSPRFLFRFEIPQSETELSPEEKTQSLSYTLADSSPSHFPFIAQQNSHPSTSERVELENIVAKLLESHQAKEKLQRFILSWLEIREPEEFQISPVEYAEFTPAVAQAAVTDIKSFIEFQLKGASPKLRVVTQSTESFVSDASAFIYGSPGSGAVATAPTKLDSTQRLGIFSQSAFIASHSGPTSTRLIKRGVFFVRKVMCLPLGSPQNVDTTLPPDSGITQRQKITNITSPGQCVGCHSMINPFGFFLENYNAFGRWQTHDAGHPIDVSIAVNLPTDGGIRTASTVDALRAITSTFRFEECFVRQLFRYYMGRTEAPGDDLVLRKMFVNFSAENQDLVSILTTLANSDRLYYRKGN